jgi:hypothetical protein
LLKAIGKFACLFYGTGDEDCFACEGGWMGGRDRHKIGSFAIDAYDGLHYCQQRPEIATAGGLFLSNCMLGRAIAKPQHP